MSLAQRIVLALTAAGVAFVIAAHATEYILFNVRSHTTLAQHAAQAVVVLLWGAFSFSVFRHRQ